MDHSRDASEVGETGPPPKRQRVKAPRRGRPSGGRGRGRSAGSVPSGADGALENPEATDDAPKDQIAVATAPVYDFRNEPISVSLERFKAWKRAGALHDDRCFVCKEPGDLYDCPTCRRSYHDACKPQDGTDSQYHGTVHYFCDICVGRNWHSEPPLTPPASPQPGPLMETEGGTVPASERQTAQRDVPPRPGQSIAQARHPPRSPLPTNAPRAIVGLAPQADSSNPTPASQPRLLPEPSTTHPPSARRFSPINRPEEPRHPEPKRAPASRRSRYATLPPNVDSALHVLYCELEDAAGLRSQVSDLEAQLAQVRRERGLWESELRVMRKAAEVARISKSEIARLRSEVAEGQKAVDEVVALRAEKARLEAELQGTREQLDQMTQTLQEWKQKLSALIGD